MLNSYNIHIYSNREVQALRMQTCKSLPLMITNFRRMVHKFSLICNTN
jgi:hypothetical protein